MSMHNSTERYFPACPHERCGRTIVDDDVTRNTTDHPSYKRWENVIQSFQWETQTFILNELVWNLTLFIQFCNRPRGHAYVIQMSIQVMQSCSDCVSLMRTLCVCLS